MGKIMSKEQDARDLALREYDKFMEKYKQGVEAGNMKLMQHMLKLEADKIRTQSILDSIQKSSAGLDENVYDFEDTKMKIQMDSEEYRQDQAREQAFIKMATKDTTKEQAPKPAPISIGDPDKIDTYRLDAIVSVDPDTGKKVYNGPKLKSRRVVDGKEWDSSHPNYNA